MKVINIIDRRYILTSSWRYFSVDRLIVYLRRRIYPISLDPITQLTIRLTDSGRLIAVRVRIPRSLLVKVVYATLSKRDVLATIDRADCVHRLLFFFEEIRRRTLV